MAKSIRNRYLRSLEGLNAQGFFAPSGVSTAETTATDLKGFVAAAVEGSIAVFDASDNSVVTAALTAGNKYFFGQIVDGELKRSTVWTAGQVEVQATAFDAPVIQTTAIGWNGTSGDLNIDIVGGLQEFVLRINETTPASQPFPTIEGRAIVRNPNTNDYEVASAIANDINGVYDYEQNEDEKAVEVYVVTQGASAAFTNAAATSGLSTAGKTTIVVDDASDAALVGSLIKFAAAGANPSAATYKVVSVATGGAVESITLDRPLVDDVADGTDVTKVDYDPNDMIKDSVGLIVRALAEDVVFSVGVTEDLAAADIKVLTEWKQGSGAPWQVAAMEKETQVFAGETTQNIAFREDFGRPNSFVNGMADPTAVVNQYSLWFIKYNARTDSMGYMNEYVDTFGYVILGVPGAANANLAGQFSIQFDTPA